MRRIDIMLGIGVLSVVAFIVFSTIMIVSAESSTSNEETTSQTTFTPYVYPDGMGYSYEVEDEESGFSSTIYIYPDGNIGLLPVSNGYVGIPIN